MCGSGEEAQAPPTGTLHVAVTTATHHISTLGARGDRREAAIGRGCLGVGGEFKALAVLIAVGPTPLRNNGAFPLAVAVEKERNSKVIDSAGRKGENAHPLLLITLKPLTWDQKAGGDTRQAALRAAPLINN
ncbi:hypothetical protein SKAU_G00385160 [Synaphobranchus kaupii]|uniref:Uncharacterized protein n=1 Tax=Synaphobranchus kaupii TaxID=118154 RepID=A0A9Q1EEG5_SYNKA|nr:hypothetical protein SKAU_G00385160 [Synaphobranchus kaupii]